MTRATFLVVRASLTVARWSARPSIWKDTHYQGLEEEDNGPVRVPEAVCFDREAAERERTRRERAAREVVNPFWLGPVRELSSRDERAVSAGVLGLGLLPPPAVPKPTHYDEGVDWVAWWDEQSANWTAEQRSAVWELFDKVRLFEVIEVELE